LTHFIELHLAKPQQVWVHLLSFYHNTEQFSMTY